MSFEETVEMKLCELLADRPKEIGELAVAMRRQVCRTAGSASELLYRTYAVSNVFTFTDRLKEAFIHIATYSEHVNLGFNYGAQLPDPQQLLEGSGKAIRHIRIENVADLKKPAIKKLVQEAIGLGRSMAENAGGIQQQKFYDKT